MRSSMSGARSFHYSGRRRVPAGEQTFLTEHSFGVTRDRLVELITDVHPFVAHWEDLTKLSLEGRGCGSVARLKEFLPQLIEVNL
jgi:protein NUD1